MRLEWVLVPALAVLVLVGLQLVQRRDHSPTGHWVGAWAAAALGGLLLLLGSRHPALRALSLPFFCLFAWFLLAGALVLRDRRVPRWLLPLGLGLGVARASALWLGHEPLANAAGFVTDLPAILVSAWFVRGAVPGLEPSFAQRALAPALVLLAGCGALHLYWLVGGAPQEWLLMLWMFAAPPLLGIQLRAGAEWTRRELVAARRELEGTVAERTAELARVNESLRRSEERYRTISELSSDLAFSFRIHPDGLVEGEWITDAFGRMTGFSVSEMEGPRWLELIHPDDRAPVAAQFRAALDRGTATLHFRVVAKDGSVRWFEARERISRDADGIRAVGACRDVSEARQAEAERLALERRFHEAQRLESLGLVTGGVAHDFNNQLTVILGNARLALADLPPGQPARARLARIVAAAEHGAALTDQMLVYSGRAPRARKPVDLSQLVQDALDLARASLPAHVAVEEQIEAPVWVQGDETQLRQVVINLVTNAAEAIGGRPGRVTVRSGPVEARAEDLAETHGAEDFAPGRCALLEVRDDGDGVMEAAASRIFEPFFTTKLSGRGIGLAAVLGIVRGHGGRVGVSSEPGRGACFRVWLPAEGEGRATRARGARAAEPVERRARILVIDDQEALLELASEFLSRDGFTVDTALGGAAGLARFRSGPDAFDAVVLDLAMPDVDGQQVGQAIRALRPALPLLLVSGYDAGLATGGFEALRPAGFLRKPFEREELGRALHQLLARTTG